jgi:hypothetical protein
MEPSDPTAFPFVNGNGGDAFGQCRVDDRRFPYVEHVQQGWWQR